MGTNRAKIAEQVKVLSAKLNALLEEAAKPDVRLPLEPGTDGSRARTPRFVTFVKYFNGDKPYRYAAVRPEGSQTWAVTGRRTMIHLSWEQLMAFVLDDETNEHRAAASIRQLMTPYNAEDTGLDYAEDDTDAADFTAVNEYTLTKYNMNGGY